jgi:hypothetical protein
MPFIVAMASMAKDGIYEGYRLSGAFCLTMASMEINGIYGGRRLRVL